MKAVGRDAVDEGRLTEDLASLVMGWRPSADRFLNSGRGWLPKWRFAPLSRLDDAFQLLDHFVGTYKLERKGGNIFAVRVQSSGRTGKASGEPKARTITTALCHALGLELPDEVDSPASMPVRHRSLRSRSNPDGI